MSSSRSIVGAGRVGRSNRRSRGLTGAGESGVVERHGLGKDVVENAAANGGEDHMAVCSWRAWADPT